MKATEMASLSGNIRVVAKAHKPVAYLWIEKGHQRLCPEKRYYLYIINRKLGRQLDI